MYWVVLPYNVAILCTVPIHVPMMVTSAPLRKVCKRN
uniref:Uncharacterized protein n=1 Tax=Physcomitrium patens TaxID=3218 RepID=A0A2K1JT82_PHYPA|nr:hypothetical protein PHYPA_014505 [Physcomitrium patens]